MNAQEAKTKKVVKHSPIHKPPHLKSRTMKIAIVNHSTDASLTPAIFLAIVDAVQRQVNECYTEMWQAAGVPLRIAMSSSDVRDDEDEVGVFDDADQAGALGYHDITPGGKPYGKVFLKTILADGGTLFATAYSLSVTLSHEVLELIGDPGANFWASKSDGSQVALELGDPVESDAYLIDGIMVSNFVGPRWFYAKTGPFDWMGKLSEAFSMSAGGYLIVQTDSGDVHQVFGDEYPEGRKKAKKHAASRTSRRQASTAKKAA